MPAILSGVLFLVLWLIAQSLLGMYRFPLKTGPAVRLVLSQGMLFLFLFLLGGQPLLASFLIFFTSLAALLFCAVMLLLRAWRIQRITPLQALLGMLLLFPAGGWLVWMTVPLRAGLGGLPPLKLVLDILALGITVLATTRSLWQTTIYGEGEHDQAEADREWQFWAAPTIIGLILSSVAAAVVGGLSGYRR